jgi:hypothetical protein
MTVRRQLSMFLPQPEGGMVDAVRRRFDPHQHSIIPAHITVCRDAETLALTGPGTRFSPPAQFDVDLAFGVPVLREDGAILLPVAGPTAAFVALRHALLGPECGPQLPHITLMHPRNVQGTPADLMQIRELPLPAAVRLTELFLIEQVDGGPWMVLARYGTRED